MAIHNCPHCGAIVPYAGAQCSNCARRRENERRSMNSGSGSGSRSGNSGNVTYSGGSSYSTGHSGGNGLGKSVHNNYFLSKLKFIIIRILRKITIEF